MSSIGLRSDRASAVLVLADGNTFSGTAIGALGSTVGEVVFNTSMTGYQEILTDPSYAQQMVTLTYPHIGNVGVNNNDIESYKPWAAGLIIRELSPVVSNWRAEQSLSDYLKQHEIIGIADIDTRRLTRILREKGAQSGCIIASETVSDSTIEQALASAKAFPGLAGVDLASRVTIQKPEPWTESSYCLDVNTQSDSAAHSAASQYHVVVYDFGVKYQILRKLADRGCRITRVPAHTTAADIVALQPDGILLSNGPGDPAACHTAIDTIRELLMSDVPLFGICLGFQLLALASGATTVKMKFGHHGANHPVMDEQDRSVAITSQNHGFAVSLDNLPANLRVTHRSLFDGTIQGLERTDKSAMAFQGHPEASPGPQDIDKLFDRFIQQMERVHA